MPFASGNKLGGGRPVAGKALSDMLRVALAEKARCRTNLRRIADVLVSKAVSGDMHAIKEILDRLEGRAPLQTSDGTGSASPAIIINMSPEDARIG